MRKSATETVVSRPAHVAIIMDGNGRWANQRGLPRIEGHRRGVENVRNIVRCAGELGVSYLTLYAFSVENWQRPREEVDALMNLLETFLKRYSRELVEQKVRLTVIGSPEALPDGPRQEIAAAIERTAAFTERTLVLALNYGARQEVVEAVKACIRDAKKGTLDPETLHWPTFSGYLQTGTIPDPDLIIRTSGETRLSNFLLMQAAYAEMYFSPVLWPDFNQEAFRDAIETYSRRERRFGLTGEQLREREHTVTLPS